MDYSQLIVQNRGAAYRDSQIVRWSHYNDPIDTSAGRVAGNSRIWGDASATVCIELFFIKIDNQFL
jgi:hypothetical protein